jgi:large subunit ribosomal protein L1
MPKQVKRVQPHSKRFTELLKNNDLEKIYELADAIATVKANATTKMNESIDISIRLGIDPKKGDQNVRGTTNIPHGTGKTKKVAVLAKGDQAKEAKEAGADTVGDEDLIKEIQGGFKDFDVILATEEMAPQIGKIGKILGAKTPNKRNGTVTNSIANAVKEIKGATRVEYRADKGGVVHMPIGRKSFTDEQLMENFVAAYSAVLRAKPSSAKGRYVLKLTVTSTMGVGLLVDPTAAQKIVGTA